MFSCICKFNVRSESTPIPECDAIDFGDSLRRDARIDFRRNLFVRELRSPACALDDSLTVGSDQTELDLGSAAETLLTRAIVHFQREAKHMETGVHCFVEYRGRNLGVRELRIYRERQLDQAGALLMEVSSSTREALHDDISEVFFEMAEMMRHVLLNERQASLEARDHIAGVDIGARIVDDDRNTQHFVSSDG